VLYIYFFAFIFPDQADRFLYMTESTLAQDIQFVQPDGFGHIHIKMSCFKSLWWHEATRVMMNGLFTDQHTAGVDTHMIWKVHHQRAIL